jgi:glyoxylase-like metal-dependent hydrolase (beta-lactamase superfamily II)
VYRIHRIQLGSIEGDAGEFVLNRTPGTKLSAPIYAYLIEGDGIDPVLVDTGAGDRDALRSGLKRHGLSKSDIRTVIFTHLHYDHAGGASAFPSTTLFAINRRELEFASGGMMRRDYRLEHLELFLDRTYTPGAIWFFDFQHLERQYVLPGITIAPAAAHTEGSMNVFVETQEGVACICGDVVQDVRMQIVDPPQQINHRELRLSGNSGMPQFADRTAIKALLGQVQWLLPAHDDSYQVADGRIVGCLSGPQLPGPIDALQQ